MNPAIPPQWHESQEPSCTVTVSGATIENPKSWVFVDNRKIEIPVTIISLDTPKEKK